MNLPAAFTDVELDALRASGLILSRSLRAVVTAVRPGITTGELDRIARAAIEGEGAVPSFLGYQGYPASLCTSVNDEVVHGIPDNIRTLKEGDIIGLDLGVKFRGMFTDMATTVPVGTVSEEAQHLIAVTRKSLEKGLAKVRAGRTAGDIGHAVQAYVEKNGCGVVRDLVGHGVGHHIHEEPAIPNFGRAGSGEHLTAGMAIAVEPMVTAGAFTVLTDADGWTVRTKDGSSAAHEERTVLVTKRGFELLTPWTYE